MTTATLERPTVERPITPEATQGDPAYLDYWDRIGQSFPEIAEFTTRNADRLEKLRKEVLHKLRPPHGKTLAGSAREWYLHLGSFNQLAGASNDLLVASGILLGNETAKTTHEDILMAGCMIHEAALIEPDPVRRERLLKSAHGVYGQIYSDESISWSEETKMNAAKYRHDIELKLAKTPQQRIIARIRQTEDFLKMTREDNGNGPVFEEAVIIAFAREQHELGLDEEVTIRHALPREDMPHDGFSGKSHDYLKHSFDAVIEEKIEDGKLRRVPLQFKSWDSNAGYIPQIVVINPPENIGHLRKALDDSIRKIQLAYRRELDGADIQYVKDDFFDGLNDDVAKRVEQRLAA